MRASSSTSGYARGGASQRSRPQDHQERYADFTDDIDDPVVLNNPSFDILEWHPALQSCQRYFLDHAQYEPATQAVCALINIRLPFQNLDYPITSSTQQPPLSSSPTQHYYYPPQRSSPNSPGGPGGGSGNLSPFAHHNVGASHQTPNQPRAGAGGGGSTVAAVTIYPRTNTNTTTSSNNNNSCIKCINPPLHQPSSSP